MKKIINLFGEVNEDMCEAFVEEYTEAIVNGQDIVIFLNTSGGGISSGLAIHDLIKTSPVDVAIIALGRCMSSGVTIFCGAKKENRFAMPNTRFMIHQAAMGYSGKTDEIKIDFDELNRLETVMFNILSKASGKSMKRIRKDTKTDYYMSATEAIEYGFVGKIVDTLG